MRSLIPMICGPLFLVPALAAAEVPRVAADIAPVHALVARVMQGVGEPGLIVPPGASPHGHAMRPSQAGLVADADLIFWAGEALTPWLGQAIETLAPDAASVELLEAEGAVLLEFRQSATFETHDHAAEMADHADVQGGDGTHRDHEDEAAEGAEHDHEHDAADADAHTATEGDDHAADHAGHAADPHAWLDPRNGQAWLAAIATALAQADPANAGAYAANAAAGASEIGALETRLADELAPVRDRPFVVFHDGYHYFERRFDIEAAGAITLGDGSDPSPARVREIRERVVTLEAACVFTEPQFEPRLVATVTEGTRARPGTLDPLGASLTPGADLYPRLLQGLADDLVACLR